MQADTRPLLVPSGTWSDPGTLRTTVFLFCYGCICSNFSIPLSLSTLCACTSWHRLSYAETHILAKARSFLRYMTDPDHAADLRRLSASGLQCNAKQRDQQEVIMKEIHMDICSEVEWYKLAQLRYVRLICLLPVTCAINA